MRRRRTGFVTLAAFATVAAVAALAACDTDDGRQMQTPDSYARYQLQSTAPSTTSTVAPPPTELAVVPTTSPSTSTTSSTTSTSTPASLSDASTTTGAGGAVIDAASDSTAQLMQFSGPWDDGSAIPASFTCDGAGDAPLVTWTAPPDGTVELALSVTDTDANGFVHWLVIDLPAQAGSLGGGEPTVVGVDAVNSFGDPGWGGPCPPPGGGPHTYAFTLHLLDQQLELPADTPTDDLLTAIEAATAETATFTGTYERA